jgi:hypothetical protein
MADHRDRLVQIVRMKGPLIPSQLNRELNTNLLFASAMLSELVDKKVLKLTHLKVGGSPLYYAPGQEHRLQEFGGKLGEKDKRAFELLRQQKVLRDKEQEPLTRACLREIKDFAVPLEVNFEGSVELFWKWHLLSNEEAEPLIRRGLGLDQPKAAPEAKDPLFEKKLELARKVMQEKDEPKKAEERKRDEAPQRKLEEKARPKAERAPKAEKPVKAAETQDTPLPDAFIDRGEPDDAFFRKVKAFFDASSIRILSHKVIRKESDIEFTVEIPSAVGKLAYFCKAKDKQKLNDGDLSAVYIQSQSKKLPVLFVTTGELTKKAQDILSKEFKSMAVKRL